MKVTRLILWFLGAWAWSGGSPAQAAPSRPRGMYIPVPPGSFVPAAPPVAGANGDIIFMNRNGGTYTCGNENSSTNSSVVPCQTGTLTIPAFPYGDAAWNQFMSCVRTMYAPFNVQITDVDPGSTAHFESVVGGDGSVLGPGVGGVAPYDQFSCGTIPRAISYTFAETIGANMQVMCEVAAQETAHVFGLDHELYCPDPMTYLTGCGAKSFRDYDSPCGEYSARTCQCNFPTQNSYRRLLAALGSANPCTIDDDCDSTDICYQGRCILGPDEIGGLGDVCTGDNVCDSGRCEDRGGDQRCAASCVPGNPAADCPTGFACVDNNGQNVCWPSGLLDSGCCAVVGARRRHASPLPWLAAGGALFVVLATRRRRR